MKAELITVHLAGGSRNWVQVARTLDNQARSGRPNSGIWVVHQAIETDLASSSQRVSGKFSITLSSMVFPLHHLSKTSRIAELCLILPKYCKTFESPYYYHYNYHYNYNLNFFFCTSVSVCWNLELEYTKSTQDGNKE